MEAYLEQQMLVCKKQLVREQSYYCKRRSNTQSLYQSQISTVHPICKNHVKLKSFRSQIKRDGSKEAGSKPKWTSKGWLSRQINKMKYIEIFIGSVKIQFKERVAVDITRVKEWQAYGLYTPTPKTSKSTALGLDQGCFNHQEKFPLQQQQQQQQHSLYH